MRFTVSHATSSARVRRLESSCGRQECPECQRSRDQIVRSISEIQRCGRSIYGIEKEIASLLAQLSTPARLRSVRGSGQRQQTLNRHLSTRSIEIVRNQPTIAMPRKGQNLVQDRSKPLMSLYHHDAWDGTCGEHLNMSHGSFTMGTLMIIRWAGSHGTDMIIRAPVLNPYDHVRK
jgi:hypothetical protein